MDCRTDEQGSLHRGVVSLAETAKAQDGVKQPCSVGKQPFCLQVISMGKFHPAKENGASADLSVLSRVRDACAVA